MDMKDLTAGTYVIGENVKNPQADRRKTCNFSAESLWLQGTKVSVKEDEEFKGVFTINRIGGRPWHGINGTKTKSRHPAFPLLVAALIPVEVSDEEWLRANVEGMGHGVLLRLMKAGKITRDDIVNSL